MKQKLKNLENEFEVWAPPKNCRFAKYTLCNLKGWLNAYGETPNVIHRNNGFWDTCIRYEEVEKYECFCELKDEREIYRISVKKEDVEVNYEKCNYECSKRAGKQKFAECSFDE